VKLGPEGGWVISTPGSKMRIALAHIIWRMWEMRMNTAVLYGFTKVKPLDDPCACLRNTLRRFATIFWSGVAVIAFGYIQQYNTEVNL
jgi:hypothetical protein